MAGAPIPKGATPEASGELFQMFVFTQLVAGVPDKHLNCVEDAVRMVGPTIQYFPNIFPRLPKKAYIDLGLRLKHLFPPTDPWVQALPETLGMLFEVHGLDDFWIVQDLFRDEVVALSD